MITSENNLTKCDMPFTEVCQRLVDGLNSGHAAVIVYNVNDYLLHEHWGMCTLETGANNSQQSCQEPVHDLTNFKRITGCSRLPTGNSLS